MKITHVTFSGGGISGVSYIGCLRFLHMEGLVKDIRHISGTSIGAFFAAALALDIPYPKFETLLREFCTKHYTFSTQQILGMFTSMGIDDGTFMIDVLHQYVKELTNENDISFIELTKRTGKNLIICANRVETMSAFYFSVDTTPHVGVLEAVQASMSVPIFIRPKKIGDYHYSDGATNDNTPTSCFPDSAVTHLIFLLGSKQEPSTSAMDSFMSYIIAHFNTYMSYLIQKSKKTSPWVIDLHECPVSFLPFQYHKDGIVLTMSEEKFNESLCYGYDAVQRWFTQHCLDNPS